MTRLFIRRNKKPKVGKYFLKITRDNSTEMITRIGNIIGVMVPEILNEKDPCLLYNIVLRHPFDLAGKEDTISSAMLKNRETITLDMIKYFFGPANPELAQRMPEIDENECKDVWALDFEDSKFAIAYSKKTDQVHLMYFRNPEKYIRAYTLNQEMSLDDIIRERVIEFSKDERITRVCESFLREILNMMDYYYDIQARKYTLKHNPTKKNRYDKKDLPWQ